GVGGVGRPGARGGARGERAPCRERGFARTLGLRSLEHAPVLEVDENALEVGEPERKSRARRPLARDVLGRAAPVHQGEQHGECRGGEKQTLEETLRVAQREDGLLAAAFDEGVERADARTGGGHRFAGALSPESVLPTVRGGCAWSVTVHRGRGGAADLAGTA